MGIFENSADYMTSREGDFRVWRTGLFPRRRYAIRNDEDRKALAAYGRGSAFLVVAFVVVNPVLLAGLENRKLALTLSFSLAILLLGCTRVLHRRLSRALDPPLD